MRRPKRVGWLVWCHSVLLARPGEHAVIGRRVLVGERSQWLLVAHFGEKSVFGRRVLVQASSQCVGGSNSKNFGLIFNMEGPHNENAGSGRVIAIYTSLGVYTSDELLPQKTSQGVCGLACCTCMYSNGRITELQTDLVRATTVRRLSLYGPQKVWP